MTETTVALSHERSAIDVLGGPDLNPESMRSALQVKLAKVRDLTEGGQTNARKYMEKGPAETDAEYRRRRHSAVDVPLCRFGCDMWAHLAQGIAPNVSYYLKGDPPPDTLTQVNLVLKGESPDDIEDATTLNDGIRDIFESNNGDLLKLKVAKYRVRDGVGWLKHFVVKEGDRPTRYGLAAMPCDEFFPALDPDDETQLIGGLEYRRASKTWVEWNKDTWQPYKWDGGKLAPIHEPVPHDWGCVPFAYFGDLGVYGIENPSILHTVADRQVELIERASIANQAGSGQAFSTLHIDGKLNKSTHKPNPTKNRGEGKRDAESTGTQIEMGLNRILHTQDGGGQFLRPGFPFAELRADFDATLQMSVNLDLSLPGGLMLAPGGPAEQPTTLQHRMLIMEIRFRPLAMEGESFHKQNATIMNGALAMNSSMDNYDVGDTVDEGELTCDVEYRESPIPQSKDAEREHDRRDVESGLMTTAEYRAKYHDGDAPIDERAETLKQLQEANSLGGFLDSEPAPRLEPTTDTGEADFNEITLGAQRLGSVGDVEGFNALRKEALRRLGVANVADVDELARPAQGRGDDG